LFATGREGPLKRLGLLVRQRALGPSGGQDLGIDAGAGPRVEAAHHEAVSLGIEEGEREALVATGVLERIEADETDLLKRPPPVGLEDGWSRSELVQLGGNGIDLVDVRLEDRFETVTSFAARDPCQAVVEPADPSRLDDDDEEQNENRESERADDSADVRFDERVEIDGSAPPAGTAGV
jgi:hypothetical protein